MMHAMMMKFGQHTNAYEIQATYTNECEVRAKACTNKIGLVVVKQVQ